LTRLHPSDDALHTVADHAGNLLHGLDLGTHNAGSPLSEHGAHDIDLFSIQDLAQMFPVNPCPCSALRGEAVSNLSSSVRLSVLKLW
jgi:hypothetical protein